MHMNSGSFVGIACDLEDAGLVWQPEIGDEVAPRRSLNQVSILVDPQGMGPDQLRNAYLWLPTVEQILLQFEVRQAILFHAGLELGTSALLYKTVIQANGEHIERQAESLRSSLALSLRDLLLANGDALH